MLGETQIYVPQVRLVNPNVIDILNAGHFRNGEVVIEELFALGLQMGKKFNLYGDGFPSRQGWLMEFCTDLQRSTIAMWCR